MPQSARLILDGEDQAVLLPDEFRFEGKEVFIRRDPATGDVILSQRRPEWDRFFALLGEGEIPEGFLSPEERDQGPQDRDPLEGLKE
jgi:antitoxin VapB